jgi:hypothetical protein
MKPYSLAEERLRPVLRVAMPRPARLQAPGGTAHVVARFNNREFCFTTPADFELLLAHLVFGENAIFSLADEGLMDEISLAAGW